MGRGEHVYPPAQTILRAAGSPGCRRGRAAAGQRGMSLQGSPPREMCPAPAQLPSLQKTGCSCTCTTQKHKTASMSTSDIPVGVLHAVV